MRHERKLRTRKQIEEEYDALVNLELSGNIDRSFEKASVINCLQWVLWGTVQRPSEWLKPLDQKRSGSIVARRNGENNS